jgi:probable HAF family extracellular repeat protein
VTRTLCAIAVAVVTLAHGDPALSAEDRVWFMELPSGVLPRDVGANASVIAGIFANGGALYWMPTSGVQSIGGTSTNAISLDGKTIIGRAFDSQRHENAAIWQGGKEWRLLGSFTPDAEACDLLLSGSFGASDDGRVIVGLAWNGCRYARAFRWEESTGMVDLGSSNGQSTRANNISGDGSVVVGWQQDLTGFRMGAKWTGRTQELFKGPSGMVGEAFGVNRNASIVVGATCDPQKPEPSSAWKWTINDGMRCFPVERPAYLPRYPYQTVMVATSDDGRVIAGSFTFGLDAESLIWLDGEPSFLKDYLRQNGYPDAFRGWVNTGFVTSVSPDGRTLVGYGAGPEDFQGFLVLLPKRESK